MAKKQKLYSLVAVFLVICVGIFGVSQFEEAKENIKDSCSRVKEKSCEELNKKLIPSLCTLLLSFSSKFSCSQLSYYC